MLENKVSEEDRDILEVYIQVCGRSMTSLFVCNETQRLVMMISTGSFWEYFPSFEYPLTHLEKLKRNRDVLGGLGADSADMVTTHIHLAWMKLNEYYDKLWPVACIGAVVLHPCFGWSAF
jgi:hypothetical protein